MKIDTKKLKEAYVYLIPLVATDERFFMYLVQIVTL